MVYFSTFSFLVTPQIHSKGSKCKAIEMPCVQNMLACPCVQNMLACPWVQNMLACPWVQNMLDTHSIKSALTASRTRLIGHKVHH
jgi:hypothetical protein